jgi:hypothetical protein
MALFDRETDPAKERDGVPLDFGDHRVTLRRQGGANDRYEQELEKISKPYRAAIRAGVLPKDREEELVMRAFLRGCVVRWETLASTLPDAESLRRNDLVASDGFVDGIDLRGKLVPYTEESALEVYKALRGVFLDHREAARGEQLFRLEQREDDSGN